MKKFLLIIPFFTTLAFGQGATLPCSWTNVPINNNNISFQTTVFANSGTGAFFVEGFQLQFPCLAQGNFTIEVGTVDSGSGTTNKYALGLYYNSGGTGTVGALYMNTGEFNGTSLHTVTTAQTFASIATTPCPTFPCVLPAGIYAFAFATNVSSGATVAKVGGNAVNGTLTAFSQAISSGYSAGLPSTLSAAPITSSPVSMLTQPAISVFIW